jgi:hypothetical protein
MFPHTGTLVALLNNELTNDPGDEEYGRQSPMGNGAPPKPKANKKRLFKTFNVLKGGFYSKNREVVSLCGILFTRLGHELNQFEGGLAGESWDWFTK